MRLHRNLCSAVIDGTLEVFNDAKYADKVIQSLLKRDKRWGSRDRGFIAETTYDIVRWKRLYAEIAKVNETRVLEGSTFAKVRKNQWINEAENCESC